LQVELRIAGRRELVRARRHLVSPGYFRTLGAPLLEGRDFSDRDELSAPRVAVIDRHLSQRYWPNQSPLHHQLEYLGDAYDIVGVVGDVRHAALVESGAFDVYFPFYQLPPRGFAIVGRSSQDPAPLVAAIRREVTALDSTALVSKPYSGNEIFAEQTARQRLVAAVLTAFAVTALAITIVGIYGVIAYTAARQTRQTGIRIALGASRGDVLRLVLGGALRFTVAGLASGSLAALALARLLTASIYGITPTDPLTFGTATIVLTAIAFLGSLIPAIRATTVDPVFALKAE
jgi:putative ABC transport system permease protein